MEEFIIYAIVIISIIVNIYKNFQKQKEKDSKRVIGKPAPNQTSTTSSVPSSNSQPTKTSTLTKGNKTQKRKSEIELAIEKIEKENPELAYKYASIENDSSFNSSLNNSSITFDSPDEICSLEEDSLDIPQKTNRIGSLFESKDDFKKAILYNTILERKYN